MIWLFLLLAVALVALGALMAALDAAIVSLSNNDLELMSHGARFGRSIRAIAASRAAHLNAINFVRITAETTAAVVVALLAMSLTDSLGWSLLWAALSMSLVSFALVGVSPRSVGHARSELLVRWFAPLVRGLRLVLGPIAAALVVLGNRVTPGRDRGMVSSERELLSMVDQATASEVLEEDDRQLIRSVLEFDDTVVRAVMVPRTDMVTVAADATLAEAMAVFLQSGKSRIPVVGDDIDDTEQVLYLRDVAQRQFSGDLDGTAASMARVAPLVPDSLKLDALLRQMQQHHTHLVLVVDEYGGLAGLVTLEDLIEELVGEIADEHDQTAAEVVELGDGRYRVSARLSVAELGDLFDLELDDEDVDTVGGLLAKTLGRLPFSGDSVETSGLRLTAGEVIARRRLVNVLVEADQALLDARAALREEAE